MDAFEKFVKGKITVKEFVEETICPFDEISQCSEYVGNISNEAGTLFDHSDGGTTITTYDFKNKRVIETPPDGAPEITDEDEDSRGDFAEFLESGWSWANR